MFLGALSSNCFRDLEVFKGSVVGEGFDFPKVFPLFFDFEEQDRRNHAVFELLRVFSSLFQGFPDGVGTVFKG